MGFFDRFRPLMPEEQAAKRYQEQLNATMEKIQEGERNGRKTLEYAWNNGGHTNKFIVAEGERPIDKETFARVILSNDGDPSKDRSFRDNILQAGGSIGEYDGSDIFTKKWTVYTSDRDFIIKDSKELEVDFKDYDMKFISSSVKYEDVRDLSQAELREMAIRETAADKGYISFLQEWSDIRVYAMKDDNVCVDYGAVTTIMRLGPQETLEDKISSVVANIVEDRMCGKEIDYMSNPFELDAQSIQVMPSGKIEVESKEIWYGTGEMMGDEACGGVYLAMMDTPDGLVVFCNSWGDDYYEESDNTFVIIKDVDSKEFMKILGEACQEKGRSDYGKEITDTVKLAVSKIDSEKVKAIDEEDADKRIEKAVQDYENNHQNGENIERD